MPYGYGTDARYRPPVPRVTAPRSPNNRGGALGVGAAPFPTLARSLAPAPRATSPFTSGYGGPAGVSSAPPTASPPRAAPAPPAQQPNTNPAAPTVAYDYSADPVLNQIQAIGVQDRASAEANALRLKKQLAIDYGDPDLANQLGDTNTAQAATDNPFSVRQQLATSYQRGQTGLEDQYNKANLFYGGARIKGLGDLANQYQGQLAGALGQEQSALGGIGDQLNTALSAANARDVQAQQDAANRALQLALANGIDPGAGAWGSAVAPPPGGTPLDGQVAASLAANPAASTGGYAGEQMEVPLPVQPAAAVQGGLAAPAVGTTMDPLIYALLGRKMDPRLLYT
jgi:hypothetical protein